MRVAWIVYGDLAQPTGGYVYDRLIVEALRARGDEIVVVDPLEGLRTPHASPLPPRGGGGGGVFDAMVGDALCARELGDIFERAQRRTARVLLVHHFASWEVERDDRVALRVIEARAVAACHHMVVTSEATGARLVAEYPGRAVDVVVPGSDRLPVHRRASRGDGRVQLLFVGSIIPRKGLPTLLDAIERLADSRLALTVVGDGGRAPEHTRALAARIDGSTVLRACVTAVGVLDDDALARRMAQADALVLPSSLEGYGMVITEALHAGLAVLATREAALATKIADSAAAIVFDDVHELTTGLRGLVRDPLLRAAMHRAAREATLPRWSETVAAFRDVLTRAVARAAEHEPDRAPSR
jgi:glycosyltransferase involved in cell wall biosynthesis